MAWAADILPAAPHPAPRAGVGPAGTDACLGSGGVDTGSSWDSPLPSQVLVLLGRDWVVLAHGGRRLNGHKAGRNLSSASTGV